MPVPGVCLLLLALHAGDLPLAGPLPIWTSPGPDWTFCYDDCTAAWITWSGKYRGVWFEAADFGGWPSQTIDHLEFWFYHDASYPWDTSSFYAGLYEGGPTGPESLLVQTLLTASSYAPVYADYGPSGQVEVTSWWCVENTELSGGGWPSLLGDGTPNLNGTHSYFSNDLTLWQSWVPTGPTSCDYIIRSGWWEIGLNQTTWGLIKTLF